MRATSPLLRRIRHIQLTGKTGPRGYYKGTRSGSMGSHTKHGGYIVDFDKVRTYVVPTTLDSCKVSRLWTCHRDLSNYPCARSETDE